MTILFSDQRHIHINQQSYREAKVISQNNIQKIVNIIILQRVVFIYIEVNTGNL